MQAHHVAVAFAAIMLLSAPLALMTAQGEAADVPVAGAAAALPTPHLDVYPAPASFDNADGAGEPSLGVNWLTNAAMYQAYTDTYRVTWDDTVTPPAATWTDVTSPFSLINIDPIAFTDSAVGRTYAGGLDGECSILSFSDDDGASWLPVGNSCAGPIDHPTVGSGPAAGLMSDSPLRVAYYCAQQGYVACAASYDGGITYQALAPVSCASQAPGFHGSVHVGQNGYAYLPFADCGGGAGVAYSTNNGLSWQSSAVPYPAAHLTSLGFDPDVATTPDNRLHMAFVGADYRAYYSGASPTGLGWSEPVDVGADLGIQATSFVEMMAGDNDRLAVAYLGSTTAGNPYSSSFFGIFHLYVSYSFDAGSTWQTSQVTTDPVQVGWICATGTGCGGARNLLDFIDAQVDAEGRVIVGFADGCVGSCASGAHDRQSSSAYATIARQSAGPRLLAAFDPEEEPVATPPLAPTLTGSASPTSVELAWSQPYDGGAAISGYTLYRDGAILATLAATIRSYQDTDVTTGTSYAYRMTASNSVGVSPSSAVLSLTPAQTPPAPPAPELENGVTHHDTLDEDWHIYRVALAAGDTLTVELSGPDCLPGIVLCLDGDLDLYVNPGSYPDESTYECRPYSVGSQETCTVTAASDGYWYIGVQRFDGDAPAYDLTASWS